MKIKRYTGNNTQEALLKVKMDLGNDALILNTKKVRKKGILGLFSQPMIEVMAAVDEQAEYKKLAAAPLASESQRPVQKSGTAPAAVSTVPEKNDRIFKLEQKVDNMDSMLKKIYTEFKTSGFMGGEAGKTEGDTQPNMLKQFYDNLLKNEVEPEIAQHIINTAVERAGNNPNFTLSTTALFNILAEILGKPRTIQLRQDGKPTVVAFIGPTGVGKTTTLAKIAADYALHKKMNVALITADTYRIAAVDQLKTYAEILGMPLSVVYTAEDLKEALVSYGDKDIILVDTAGSSYRNTSQFNEIRQMVESLHADEVFLVMSTTSSAATSKQILEHYKFLSRYNFIFTKVDESQGQGVILNAIYATKKPLSYITNGQSVPDDIEVANINQIAKQLLGSLT